MMKKVTFRLEALAYITIGVPDSMGLDEATDAAASVAEFNLVRPKLKLPPGVSVIEVREEEPEIFASHDLDDDDTDAPY
jgi:hypothetical protein